MTNSRAITAATRGLKPKLTYQQAVGIMATDYPVKLPLRTATVALKSLAMSKLITTDLDNAAATVRDERERNVRVQNLAVEAHVPVAEMRAIFEGNARQAAASARAATTRPMSTQTVVDPTAGIEEQRARADAAAREAALERSLRLAQEADSRQRMADQVSRSMDLNSRTNPEAAIIYNITHNHPAGPPQIHAPTYIHQHHEASQVPTQVNLYAPQTLHQTYHAGVHQYFHQDVTNYLNTYAPQMAQMSVQANVDARQLNTTIENRLLIWLSQHEGSDPPPPNELLAIESGGGPPPPPPGAGAVAIRRGRKKQEDDHATASSSGGAPGGGDGRGRGRERSPPPRPRIAGGAAAPRPASAPSPPPLPPPLAPPRERAIAKAKATPKPAPTPPSQSQRPPPEPPMTQRSKRRASEPPGPEMTQRRRSRRFTVQDA